MKPKDHIWVHGGGRGVVYLVDLAVSDVRRYTVSDIRKLAGRGRFVGSRFVAVYVDPQSRGLVLMVGRRRFPLDGLTRAYLSEGAGGLWSTLRIERPGEESVTLRKATIIRGVSRRIDPTYDALEESVDDFLLGIAYSISTEDGMRGLMETTDPEAGPWELLE